MKTKYKLLLLFILLVIVLLKVIPWILGIVFSFMWFCLILGMSIVGAALIMVIYEIRKFFKNKNSAE